MNFVFIFLGCAFGGLFYKVAPSDWATVAFVFLAVLVLLFGLDD